MQVGYIYSERAFWLALTTKAGFSVVSLRYFLCRPIGRVSLIFFVFLRNQRNYVRGKNIHDKIEKVNSPLIGNDMHRLVSFTQIGTYKSGNH